MCSLGYLLQKNLDKPRNSAIWNEEAGQLQVYSALIASGMAGDVMGSKHFIVGMYLFITLICVLVSTYVTIIGFWTLLEVLAIPVGLAIGAALFATDYLIKDRLERGQGIGRALLMLLVAMAASWVSHFNYFYTNAIADRAVTARVEAAHARYASHLSDALLRLGALPANLGATERNLRITQEFARLRSEALDPRQPGIGEQSEGHIAEINRLLGVEEADVVRPVLGASLDEVAGWIDDYEARVREQLRLIEGGDPVVTARTEVLASQAAAGADLRDALAGSPAEQRALIERWERDTSSLNTSVTFALHAAGALPPNETVRYQPVPAGGAELGEITHSLYDGFVARTDFNVTIFATLASILIDILPLLVGILLLGRRSRFPIAEEDESSLLDPIERDDSAHNIN